MPQTSRFAAAPRWPAGPRFTCFLEIPRRHSARVRVEDELDLSTSPQLERALREARLEGRLVVSTCAR